MCLHVFESVQNQNAKAQIARNWKSDSARGKHLEKLRRYPADVGKCLRTQWIPQKV